MLDDPDLSSAQIAQLLNITKALGVSSWNDAMEYANEYKDYHGLNENILKFIDLLKLSEGGKRRHIPQTLRDKFIHSILIIPRPEDRQSEVDSIFAEIAEKNQAAYFKAHPELVKEQDEGEGDE